MSAAALPSAPAFAPLSASGVVRTSSSSPKRVLLVFSRRSPEAIAMLRGIARYQRSHGAWSVFVDDDNGTEYRSEDLWNQPWDGVISGYTTPGLVATCARRGVPLVDLTDGPSCPGVPQVRPDNITVGHIAAEDLVERGYTHFGFCGFSNQSWSVDRRRGFIEGLKLQGKECRIYETMMPSRSSPSWDAQQVPSIAEWLWHQPRPLAVLACHDQLGAQVIEAARLCSFSVPEDLAVLGVNDDVACCEMSRPMLSSVSLDWSRAGFMAAEYLGQSMQGCIPTPLHAGIEPLGVVTRQSTDIFALGDRRLATALRYIRDEACRGLTVEEVVRRAAIPRHELERGLRKFIGRSPQAEIRRVQVAAIKRLLQQTDKPLKDIAERAGFEYVEYMCVVFKRMTGETPGRFRRLARSGAALRLDNVDTAGGRAPG